MPWNKSEPMNERVKFIAEWLQREESVTWLCARAGISRKTAYKWIDRYEQVASTVGDILRRAGMVRPRRRRRVSVPYGERLADYSGANAIWCADFKGHFAVVGPVVIR